MHLPPLTHHPKPGPLAPAPRQACLPTFASRCPHCSPFSRTPACPNPSRPHPFPPLQAKVGCLLRAPRTCCLPPVPLCQELWKPWVGEAVRNSDNWASNAPSQLQARGRAGPLQSFGFFTCKRASSSGLPEGVGPECRVRGCECSPGGLGWLGPP